MRSAPANKGQRFTVWPVWWDVVHRRHRDALGQYDLTRQSGPFLPSELPATSLT
jgi:hypothetical protein